MAGSFAFDNATWRVKDLASSIAFYERLGFRTRKVDQARAELVAAADADRDDRGEPPLLRLVADPVATEASGRGAYHIAFRVPTRRDLAATLHRVAADRTPVDGYADHLVSEAIYLPDADGHGLEFTWDRPRDAWRYPGGTLAIGTDPLDVRGLLAELGEGPTREPQLPSDVRLGHVHLYAADVGLDSRWYREALGLDEVISFGPWGTFLAADGYHHHVGLRRGAGATDPTRDHGLVEIEARLSPERYVRLDGDEIDGAKAMHAPSGHCWRLRPFGDL